MSNCLLRTIYLASPHFSVPRSAVKTVERVERERESETHFHFAGNGRATSGERTVLEEISFLRFGEFCDFVPALAHHFCLIFPASSSQPGNGRLAEPGILKIELRILIETVICIILDPRFQTSTIRNMEGPLRSISDTMLGERGARLRLLALLQILQGFRVK